MKTIINKLLFPVFWIYDLVILFIYRRDKSPFEIFWDIKDLGIPPKPK